MIWFAVVAAVVNSIDVLNSSVVVNFVANAIVVGGGSGVLAIAFAVEAS